MKMNPFARFFAFLPPAGFHMTVFGGYATGVALDALAGGTRSNLNAATARLLAQIEGIALPARQRARMKDLFCLKSVTLTEADAGEEATLCRTRDAPGAATGLGSDDRDDNVFHINLAYLLERLTEPTARAVAAYSAEMTEEWRDAVGEIDRAAERRLPTPRLVVGCSCHEYRMLAFGHADMIVSPGVNPWEHAAGVLVAEECGGACLSGGAPGYDPARPAAPLLVSGRAEGLTTLAAWAAALG